MAKAYRDLIEAAKETHTFELVESVLAWDQETQMPPDGVKARSNQMASMSKLIHEMRTSTRMRKLLEELQREKEQKKMTEEQRANVRWIAWEHHRATALPSEFVSDLAKTRSEANHAWIDARKKSSFKLFYPYLSKLVDMKRREAEYIGYEDRPYDALMDAFEPGLTSAHLDKFFPDLRKKLTRVVEKIIDSGVHPETDFITCRYPVKKQEEFYTVLSRKLGYNFKRGRMDVSAHPFTIGDLYDTRITVRYDPADPRPAMFAAIHEVGHALYQQGFLPKHYGTPMGQPVSLGIHESQSRMWENLVGRSLEFWQYWHPRFQKRFPKQTKGHTAHDIYAAVNDAKPSLIRVESDESTYNLHIILRYELESALFSGKLEAEDAPGAWNDRVKEYLKLEVPNDAQGVLQDIHWSHGAFGYFPTYTLGNLYASQFFEQALVDLPSLKDDIATGNYRPLLMWLRKNIHNRGRLLTSAELVKDVTGKPLSEKPLMRHLEKKFGDLYGF